MSDRRDDQPSRRERGGEDERLRNSNGDNHKDIVERSQRNDDQPRNGDERRDDSRDHKKYDRERDNRRDEKKDDKRDRDNRDRDNRDNRDNRDRDRDKDRGRERERERDRDRERDRERERERERERDRERERERDRGGRSSRNEEHTIFIGNVPHDITPGDLERLCSQFCKRSVVDKIDIKATFAFVIIKDSERVCSRIISGLHQLPYRGKRLTVQFAKGEGKRTQKPPNQSIFIVNYNVSTTNQSIVESWCKSYGKVTRVDMRKNFCFVEYEDIAQATRALDALNGRDVNNDGYKITVEFVTGNRRDRSRSRSRDRNRNRDRSRDRRDRDRNDRSRSRDRGKRDHRGHIKEDEEREGRKRDRSLSPSRSPISTSTTTTTTTNTGTTKRSRSSSRSLSKDDNRSHSRSRSNSPNNSTATNENSHGGGGEDDQTIVSPLNNGGESSGSEKNLIVELKDGLEREKKRFKDEDGNPSIVNDNSELPDTGKQRDSERIDSSTKLIYANGDNDQSD